MYICVQSAIEKKNRRIAMLPCRERRTLIKTLTHVHRMSKCASAQIYLNSRYLITNTQAAKKYYKNLFKTL